MPGKDGIGPIIEAFVTAVTFIALMGGFCVVKAALDDSFGLTGRAVNTFCPAQLVRGLITLNIIDQILDIDLHRRTPVRV